MYHIAIVEDEKEYAEQLQTFLKQYEGEHNVKFKVTVFEDGAEILKDYQPIYDLILLDIEMPEVNGMDAADQIRKKDQEVVMMFITNIASYAIRGYEVGALDYVMKPITYYGFAMRLGRALKRVQQNEQKAVLLPLSDGVKKLQIQQIYYVEVQNRILHFYTDEGEYTIRGTMQKVEESLRGHSFAKCNHWYMVNLRHVTEVRKNIAVVAGHELEISRRNRTPFMKALAEYVGGARV